MRLTQATFRFPGSPSWGLLSSSGPAWIVWTAAILVIPAASCHSQTATCPAAPPHTATPADTASINGNYADAEQLYTQALAQRPQDAELAGALVRTLLHEGKIAEASAQANSNLAANPHSAAALTALAEVQLRQGQPWEAMRSLDAALGADRCSARAHLIRSRVLRIDSMYASERAEIQKAYDIDPNDPDIQQAWNSIVSAAQEIAGTEQSLATMKDLDAETRNKAEASIHALMPLLTENSQTCKVQPTAPSAVLPLLPSKQDGKHIDGYKLEVQFPKGNPKLTLDTAASGLFITRALADENGFHQGPDDPPGTVRVASLHIGPLEFGDCMVGVSDTPFAGKGDGSIGADMFASYLITIDPRDAKLSLDPLPRQPGPLPGDRSATAQLADYMPVYHRRQYLLVPVELDNKARRLFVVDTGMRLSAMTSETAHSISTVKMNFTNPLQTASGPPAQVYRDSFDFEFANLSLKHQNQVLEFDPSAIEHNAAFAVAGLLGFDMLHLLTMHLDYRDGLVKFESTNPEAAPPAEMGTMTASAAQASETQPAGPACPQLPDSDFPIKSTMEAKVQGALDSAHLKPGKEIWVSVVQGYSLPECTLDRNATLYGRIMAASSAKNPDASELAIAFDRGDCVGHPRHQLSLKLIGLLAPPGAASGLHEVVPTEVAGGARQISTTLAQTDGYDPALRTDSLPKTVHPGLIVGMNALSLDPQGGPGCSARISSKSRSVQLGVGAQLIFAVVGPAY
ncbi:MAG: tetratricopeptide repeat protein [Terracidiphilus sp.]